MATAQAETIQLKAGRAMFRAFTHRNFRLFWGGAFMSNIGTWMQVVAQGWLVYEITRSPFWLGVDGFIATAPGIVLTLLGGALADIFDKRKLLIYAQVLAGASALMLAALVYTGNVNLPWVLALSFVTGVAGSLAGPSYQALTVDLVGREDLPNAIALNSAQFQLSRLVGPALAGVALHYTGAAMCFLLNGVSYLFIILALSKMRVGEMRGAAQTEQKTLEPRQSPAADISASKFSAPAALEIAEANDFAAADNSFSFARVWREIRSGLRYVNRRPRVFWLLIIASVSTLFGAPYLQMLPVFAREVFQLDERGLALLMGTSGAGAFCGALMLAFLGNTKNKGWLVLGGSFGFGLCVTGFALSTNLTLSLAFIFVMGFAIVCSVAVINTMLQQLVRDKMRGRVMSLFILTFIGTMPFGNLLAGVFAKIYGVAHTLAVGGVVIMLFVLYVALTNSRLRASG